MNDTPSTLLKPITRAIGRHRLTIFIVVLVGGLAASVIILSEVMRQTSDTSGKTSSLTIATFDQDTIDRVKQLRSSSEAPPAFILPAGRTNPFSE